MAQYFEPSPDTNANFGVALCKYKCYLDRYMGLSGATAWSGCVWKCDTCGSANDGGDKECKACAGHPKAPKQLPEQPNVPPPAALKKAGSSRVSSPAPAPKDHRPPASARPPPVFPGSWG